MYHASSNYIFIKQPFNLDSQAMKCPCAPTLRESNLLVALRKRKKTSPVCITGYFPKANRNGSFRDIAGLKPWNNVINNESREKPTGVTTMRRS